MLLIYVSGAIHSRLQRTTLKLRYPRIIAILHGTGNSCCGGKDQDKIDRNYVTGKLPRCPRSAHQETDSLQRDAANGNLLTVGNGG